VQSFNAENLKFLGRKHGVEEAKTALLMALEIFENYSFDLIYCLPNQTLKEWEKELKEALQKYALGHISAYTLTIEKGTKFFAMHSSGAFSLPKIEDDFYALTNSILKENGFERYEVSNYAKGGFECKHNVGYWQSVDYLGVGAGAHGRVMIDGKRFATQNFAGPDKYLSSQNKMQTFVELSAEDVIKETLIMNLRYKNGVDIEGFKRKYGFDLMEKLPKRRLDAMVENGLLELNSSNLRLTEAGINLANSIVQKLT
jgi:oxygen-independent coproporphyrinogen-3 oxidase